VRWRRRILFLAGGLLVGALAAALAVLADQAQELFAAILSRSRYIALVLTPCGFALAVFLTNRFFPNANGSGIPQAIAARKLTDQAARSRLVSLRIAVGKILLTLLGLACGASGLILPDLLTSLDYSALTFLVISSLAAALIGRLRSLWATCFGGIAVGLAQAVVTPYSSISAYRSAAPFVLAIIALLFLSRHRVVSISRAA